MICSCTVEVNQTVATPTPTMIPTTPSTSIFPMAPVPVTWAHLNLTGKLIYLSSTMEGDTLTSHVRMLDLTSGDRATIVSFPLAWVYYATISPDGKMLVMSYVPPTQQNVLSSRILYVMPLDASVPPLPLFTAPTPNDRYIQAEWSPDGEYIYYAHYDNTKRFPGRLDPVYDIFRMKYPDSKPEKIADNAFWPRISPDSKKIVYIYINLESGMDELYIANADGTDPKQIVLSDFPIAEIIDAPIFSPDGQSILFSVPSPERSSQPNWFEKFLEVQVAKAHDVPSDWWSVPVTGGVPTQLTNIQTINLFGSISPDQKRIASMSGEGIFVMDLDGSNLTQLVSDSGVHGTVSWIP